MKDWAYNPVLTMRRRRFLKLLAGTGLSFASRTWAAGLEKAPLLKRVVPSSGEELPVIGLGTARVFDVGAAPKEREPLGEVLRLLGEVPNSMVDTSPMYGAAEEVVGDLSSQMNLRPQLFFATKVWIRGKQQGIDQMQQSMQRLRTDKIDLMQVHNLVDWQVQLRTLRHWKEADRIRYLGVTHHRNSAFDDLAELMAREALDFVQLNYSLAEPEAAQRLLPLAMEKGIAVIVNRPFAGGAMFHGVKHTSLPAWAAEFDCKSWAQFFLKFVISHPAVTCAIPATRKPNHMLDNLAAGRGKLPEEAQRQRMLSFMRTL